MTAHMTTFTPELLYAMILIDGKRLKSFLGYGHQTENYIKRIYGNRSYLELQCIDEMLKSRPCKPAKLVDFVSR